MKHLVFYRDTIQAFSLGIALASMHVAEYVDAYKFIEVKTPQDISKHLKTMTTDDIAHLEDIHILDVKPGYGKVQDELEYMLNDFAAVPFRGAVWASNYGTLVDGHNIVFVEANSTENILDVYANKLMEQSSYLHIVEPGDNASSYLWAVRGYLTKEYEYITKNDSDLVYAFYKTIGLEGVAPYVNQVSLTKLYPMYKVVIDRYKKQTDSYIARKKHSAGAVIGGMSINVLAADDYKNEIAEELMNDDMPTVVIILEVSPGRTQVTIRTSHVDARDVSSWLIGAENPQGIYNASTVFLNTEITPTMTLNGIKAIKGE